MTAIKVPVKTTDCFEGMERDLQTFWAVWAAARAETNGNIPPRNAITVTSLRSLVQNCFVVEREADGVFYFRMIGSGVERVYEQTMKDKPISAVVSEEGVDRATVFFSAMLDRPCGAYSCDIVTTHDGRKIRSAAIHLPVTNDAGNICKVISCCHITGVGFDIDAPETAETKADYRQLEDAYFIDLGYS